MTGSGDINSVLHEEGIGHRSRGNAGDVADEWLMFVYEQSVSVESRLVVERTDWFILKHPLIFRPSA
jgi:hypothetical protein